MINKHYRQIGKARTALGQRPSAWDIEHRIDAELCTEFGDTPGMHLGAAGHHYCMHVTLATGPDDPEPSTKAWARFDIAIANPPGSPVLTTSLLDGVVSVDGRGGPW